MPEIAPADDSLMIRADEIAPFASRVAWPDDKTGYAVESGVTDEGVWVEGKGYFWGTLDEVYRDFLDIRLMGPSYLTDDIAASDVHTSDVLTTYTLHIAMRMIFSVEFSLSVRIDSLYDDAGRRVGLRYASRKIDGTKFIQKIDEVIVVRAIDEGRFSAEFRSLNQATMNKEKETRKHIDDLFARWAAHPQ